MLAKSLMEAIIACTLRSLLGASRYNMISLYSQLIFLKMYMLSLFLIVTSQSKVAILFESLLSLLGDIEQFHPRGKLICKPHFFISTLSLQQHYFAFGSRINDFYSLRVCRLFQALQCLLQVVGFHELGHNLRPCLE